MFIPVDLMFSVSSRFQPDRHTEAFNNVTMHDGSVVDDAALVRSFLIVFCGLRFVC
jgi:hypothetical protein